MANYEHHHKHSTCRSRPRRDQFQPARRPHQLQRMGRTAGNRSVLRSQTNRIPPSLDRRTSCVGRDTGGRHDHQRVGRWYPHIEIGGRSICEGSDRFPYRAAQAFHQGLNDDWRNLRAVLALRGIDWRSWRAADVSAVAYRIWRQAFADDPTELKNLYELAEDSEALAGLAREMMGQTRQIQTDR
jgi:hypothetical protein